MLASFVILMRAVYLWGKLEQNWIVVPKCEPFSYSVVHIHKYSNILIHRYYLSTTPAPYLSGTYFNTSVILFSTSGSVAILCLAATLPRINKRMWSSKKEKNQAKLNAIAQDFSLREICLYSRLPCSVPTIFFLINHKRTLFWHSNLNEPQRKNYVLIIIQLSEVEIQ